MSLKIAAVSAGRWTAVSAILVAGLQMLQTVVLARILSKEDFGVMAITAAALAVLALIADFGLGRAIIHFDKLPHRALSSLYWFNLALATILMSVLFATAPVVGRLFRSPELTAALRLASLNFPLIAAGQQLRVLSEKALRFSQLARIEIISSVLGLCAAIGLAVADGGVFALVAGVLTRSAASSLLAWCWLSEEYRPLSELSLDASRKYLRFGAYSVGESLANTIHRDADVFLGGAILGPASMGIYSLPRELSIKLSGIVINPILTRVGMPVMARMRGDSGRLASVYLKLIRISSSLNVPIYFAMALFAQDIVTLLYGQEWQGASAFLRIFAAWGIVRSVANPVGSLLYATGAAKRAFWWNTGLLILLPPVYWVAARQFGSAGLAASLLLVQIGLIIPVWRYLVRPCCGAGFWEYVQQFLIPIAIGLASGIAAWIVTRDIGVGVLRLAIGAGVGGLVYLGLSWAFNRPWMDIVIETLSPKRAIVT